MKLFDWSHKELIQWKLAFIFACLFPLIFLLRAGRSPEGWFFTLFDDAMISMAYARTFAQTGELVWFPGADRIQGYTNLLWTLIMAFVHKIGLTESRASMTISLISLFCILGISLLARNLINTYLSHEKDKKIWAYLTATLIPLLYPLVFWSLRGMEVGILALLAFLVLFSSLGYERVNTTTKKYQFLTILSLSACAGVLVRLDFAAIAIVVLFLQFLLSQNKKRLLAFFTSQVMIVFVTVGAVLAFQFIYYGDFVPNTYRLKVEGYDAIDRVLNGILNIRNILAIALMVCVGIYLASKNRNSILNRVILITGGTFLSTILYSIWVGGDAWEGSRMSNRYVSVTLPFAIVSIVLSAYHFYDQIKFRENVPKIQFLFIFLIISFAYIFYPRFGSGYVYPILLISIASLLSLGLYATLNSGENFGRPQRFYLVGLILVLVSGWGLLNWGSTRGELVADDYQMSQKGIYLRKVTLDDAVIATVWAGAPAYYSQRRMIDILGKNDREIASRDPIGKINPGHNKWDYEYSIGQLKPDVVFQMWITSDSDLKKLKAWGYEEKCYDHTSLGFFRNDSEFINWPKLRDCKQGK